MQRFRLVYGARNIFDRINSRLNLWNKGAYNELVQDYYSVVEACLGDKCETQIQEKRHSTYSNLVIHGKFREAVRFICELRLKVWDLRIEPLWRSWRKKPRPRENPIVLRWNRMKKNLLLFPCI